jgi:hypothetical protein
MGVKSMYTCAVRCCILGHLRTGCTRAPCSPVTWSGLDGYHADGAAGQVQAWLSAWAANSLATGKAEKSCTGRGLYLKAACPKSTVQVKAWALVYVKELRIQN